MKRAPLLPTIVVATLAFAAVVGIFSDSDEPVEPAVDDFVYVITAELEPANNDPIHEMWGVFSEHRSARDLLAGSGFPWKDITGDGYYFYFDNEDPSAACDVPMKRGYAEIHRTIVQD